MGPPPSPSPVPSSPSSQLHGYERQLQQQYNTALGGVRESPAGALCALRGRNIWSNASSPTSGGEGLRKYEFYRSTADDASFVSLNDTAQYSVLSLQRLAGKKCTAPKDPELRPEGLSPMDRRFRIGA